MGNIRTIMTRAQFEKLRATPADERPAKAYAFRLAYGDFTSHKSSKTGTRLVYRPGTTVVDPNRLCRSLKEECGTGIHIGSHQWLREHTDANVYDDEMNPTIMLKVAFNPREAIFPTRSTGKFRVKSIDVLCRVAKSTGKQIGK